MTDQITKAVPSAIGDTEPTWGNAWHVAEGPASINISDAWSHYSGSGVKVVIVDDGFTHTNADLSNFNTSLDYDYYMSDDDTMAEEGDYHGDMVAQILGGALNGDDTVGVSYNAELIGFRVGFGAFDGGIVSALQNAHIGDIVNNSWGYQTPFSDNFTYSFWAEEKAAIENMANNGRNGLGSAVVFAAGNTRESGDDANTHSMFNNIYTITVGATDSSGNSTYFSNPGANLLISAPGASIPYSETGGTTYIGSGTSFAAPIVSGVIALMLEANPDLGWRDIQEILALSAKTTDESDPSWVENASGNWNGGGMTFNRDYGFGLVDASAAVRLAETWDPVSTSENMVSDTKSISTPMTVNNGETNYSSVVLDGFTSGLNIDKVTVSMLLGTGTNGSVSDVTIKLISPNGTEAVLIDKVNYSSGSVDFTFSANAFWGENSSGEWRLVLIDNGADAATTTIHRWTLTAYGDAETTSDSYYYTDEFSNLAATESGRATLVDTNGGIDTINAAAASGDTTINLISTRASTIAGSTLTIASGSVIENAITGSGNDRVFGNSANNELVTGRGNDTIYAGAGNDILNSGLGNDFAKGSFGDDLMYAGAGNDTFDGEDGNDRLFGEDGDDRLIGGAGNDTLNGGNGNDILEGWSGVDVIAGGSGTDRIYGGFNGDRLYGGDDRDLIWGGVGDDRILGEHGNDVLNGEDGNDTVFGGIGDDVIYGRAGIDLLYGDDDNDTLYGGTDNDSLFGGAGNDKLNGESGADIMEGGTGDDQYWIDNISDTVTELASSGYDRVYSTIVGTIRIPDHVEFLRLLDAAGASTVNGNDVSEAVFGNRHNNTILMGAGNDKVNGGAGNDILLGQDGSDMLWGASGSDRFIFVSGETGTDTIMDFVDGQDMCDLSSYVDAIGYTGNDLIADGYLTITQNGSNVDVYFDSTGSAGGNKLFSVLNTTTSVFDVNDLVI